VVHYAAIAAIAAGRQDNTLQDATKGVKRELEKEGKVFQEL